jgi:hypothetical protein
MVNKGKAISWDCMSDSLFDIGRCCKGRETCAKCKGKLDAVKKIVEKEFW